MDRGMYLAGLGVHGQKKLIAVLPCSPLVAVPTIRILLRMAAHARKPIFVDAMGGVLRIILSGS